MDRTMALAQYFPAWKSFLEAIALAGLAALVACTPRVAVTGGGKEPTTAPAATDVSIPIDAPVPTEVSVFSGQVLPIFQAKCQICHNATIKLGGWDVSSYESVMTTGDNAPVVIAGDVQNSLLAQLLQGVNGKTMPVTGALPAEQVQVILDWIAAGANQ